MNKGTNEERAGAHFARIECPIPLRSNIHPPAATLTRSCTLKSTDIDEEESKAAVENLTAMERFGIHYLYMQEKAVKKRRSQKALIKREPEEASRRDDEENATDGAVVTPAEGRTTENGNNDNGKGKAEGTRLARAASSSLSSKTLLTSPSHKRHLSSSFNHVHRHPSFNSGDTSDPLQLSDKQKWMIDKSVYFAVFLAAFAGALSTVISGIVSLDFGFWRRSKRGGGKGDLMSLLAFSLSLSLSLFLSLSRSTRATRLKCLNPTDGKLDQREPICAACRER